LQKVVANEHAYIMDDTIRTLQLYARAQKMRKGA